MPEVPIITVCCNCHIRAVWGKSTCFMCWWCDPTGKPSLKKEVKPKPKK